MGRDRMNASIRGGPISARRDAPPICCRSSLNKADGDRVAIEFSIARLDGGDDDEYRVEHPKDRQKNEPDQDKTKDRGDEVVDEHRDLEVERFFAVRIDLGRVVAFGQPDNERSAQVPGAMKKNAEHRAGVTQNVPSADIR